MRLAALRRLVPGASEALCDILSAAQPSIQPPIRSEIFGPQRFAEHGRSLGQTHHAVSPKKRASAFFPRLKSNIRMLRDAQRYIGAQAAAGHDLSPAAEWLLDNFHLIEAQLVEIRRALPRQYFRALPLLVDEPLAGLPRVYGVAWAFVAHTDSAFDEDLLVGFLAAYQETCELSLGEMWALPTTLRVVLIENLRRLAERLATHKAARELANLCCDQSDNCTTHALDRVLELLGERGVGQVFLTQMAQRLHDRGTSASQRHPAHFHDWLNKASPDLAAVRGQQGADQTADNLSVSNAVGSLRAIGDADWPGIVARTSALMRLMFTSPLFAAEHATTRDQTLHGIEQLARRSGRGERVVAQSLLDAMNPSSGAEAAADHWLRGAGRAELAGRLGLHERPAQIARAALRRAALPLYLAALLTGTLALVVWMLQRFGVGSPLWMLGPCVLLMMVPASEAVLSVINRVVGESAHPRHLPRLALAEGIPPEHRVLVAIPAMLVDAASTQALVHRLLLHYLANPERHAQFALLTDWADAEREQSPGDDALLAQAQSQVRDLNRLHTADADAAPRFIVLHRQRVFSASEGRWIGWERKRGKLEWLVTALAEGSLPFIDLGDESRIAAGHRYIVTLDSDTQLPPGRLRDLVGIAAHPQNQPQVDAKRRAVTSGYGILQPRIVTALPAAARDTPFHQLFAGQCGIDPYSAATSEIYQDVFGDGSFSGKGLLHVQAVHAVLSARLPVGRVLSHDLLEGSIARCALVSDITLIEEAPFHADVATARIHRWTRGDWQLLPFLSQPGRYGLRAVHVWKMFDNLRRSLVAPASLALLLLALSGVVLSPGAALALVAAAFGAGPLQGALAAFAPRRDDIALQRFFALAAGDLLRACCTVLWHLTQLLAQAWLAGDAVLRALFRQFISRRHLLQWTTAAAAQASAKSGFTALAVAHRREPVTALILFGLLLAIGTPWPALAGALCLLWAAAPIATWWASRPSGPPRGASLPAETRAYLEGVARDTWRFFERCVTADDNHLPPDNLQTAPHDILAHRTSPTNIGLYLLAVACARRFDWIGTPELLARLEATLSTLARLARHRGHFLNWYDTQTLAPLLPMYVSSVDSGNLCGHLLALAEACRELARAPAESAAASRLQATAERCERLAWEADFAFLYQRRRHLFHLGYRVAEQQLDAGLYDLLASESRLTSLVAIAKGDVPVRHWTALDRPFFAAGALVGLRSWSGSMFEYLMPSLVMDEPPGSVLDQACRTAIAQQIAFGDAHAVPWGVSESAYAASDHTLAYQYGPQGVPALALRRTPADELVCAPYATLLAAQIEPRLAAVNLARLERRAARGACGFIEALDFSPSRQVGTAPFTPVSTFMSHHQGMAIVALANVLFGGVARRWGMANPRIEAVASMLHERAPREVTKSPAPQMLPTPPALAQRAPGLLREVQPGAAGIEPTHLLSNGRYSVTLRANGAGFSRWGSADITRSRDDALRDALGSFFYLRWDRQPRPVSLTQHPAPDAAAHYGSSFHADRVSFDASWPEVRACATVWVSPEDDIEFRQIELHNLGERTLDIELLSAFEVTLADARADEAHPAFSNLFVRAEWQPSAQALLFARTPRLAGEPALQMAHFLTDIDARVVGVRLQTDRQRWLGRNQAACRPAASFDPPPPVLVPGSAAAMDTGLDPVCALAVRLHIAPGARARITFATAASDDGATLRAVIDKYRQASHVQRASLMSATLAGIRLHSLRLNAESLAATQMLTTALVLSVSRPQGGAAEFDDEAPSVCDRRLLWRLGISGDRPIVLVSAGVMQSLGLLRTLAQALRLWAWGGVACDLVIVNSEAASYQMALHREISSLRERHAADVDTQSRPPVTALHVLRVEELSADELSTLRSLARIRLHADGRGLPHHVQAWAELHEKAFDERHAEPISALAVPAAPEEAVPAPVGQFAAAGSEFRFEAGARLRPMRPWINVLSNHAFGAQISEAGGGHTWAVNSRLHQLTAWSNDAVADPPSEVFVLQDLRTRQAWSVTPSAFGDPTVAYRVAHGQGYSSISHRRGDVEVTASWCVDADSAVKQVRLHVVNRGARVLQLRAIGIAEWMMGASRSDRGTVHTALHRQHLPSGRLTALLATQRERSAGFGGGTAFLALAGTALDSSEDADWTCDRRECFDSRGRLVLPDHFGQRRGSGLDPCAALSASFTLAVGESASPVFLLGHGENPAAARQLAAQAAVVAPEQRLVAARSAWNELLGAATVKTPDPLFDAMVNRWLLYQAVSCRLWAKAGFYQAGGATGFRDQLQDAMALAWAAPAMLRRQIMLCASRQFAEGDVQHWWHAPNGAGVRTHFSDDLLWLPHACAHYLNATGDKLLLDERVPFIDGAAIAAGAEDAYYTPAVSAHEATVYEHAALTIDRSLRVGAHGLPLMGSGDWNDGMNRVGHQGHGESVWLGWFLCRVVADFAPLAIQRGEFERAERWQGAARGWQAALLDAGWDGHWFKRAFFDGGEPLGASANPEARIDLIAQAWAVLSGAAPAALQSQALAAVEAHLVDDEAGLIRLLDPPLQHALPSAGYIQAYPPGVRENGGQYSHAGVWALMARAAAGGGLGDLAGDLVYRDFTWLSPAHRAAHPKQGAVYGLEPYAMAGDVYSQPPYTGRGGWSWYTGAAAWMHRAAIESIFGLRLSARSLSMAPCLPSAWPRAELLLRRDGRTMRFVVIRGDSAAAVEAAAPSGARRLAPGEALDWSNLPAETCFIVPLVGAPLRQPDLAAA